MKTSRRRRNNEDVVTELWHALKATIGGIKNDLLSLKLSRRERRRRRWRKSGSKSDIGQKQTLA